MGWNFEDWPGSIALSGAFLLVLYFIPRTTEKLPSRSAIHVPNRNILLVVSLSIITLLLAHLSYDFFPFASKLLYYLFIVALGEELFFRGYFQSSVNRYFGKSFKLGEVSFGWGLLLTSVVFGLSHALVSVPSTWPWALWTFIFGLTLGFIREKDGSILAAVMLHAMVDFPLAFMS